MKHTFTDKIGESWELELNVGLIEDVKEITGVDFDKVLNEPENIATLLFAQPKKLVEVLWVMCKEQADKRNIEPKAFGYRFDRESIDLAANALIGSIISFYPRGLAGRILADQLPEIIEKMDRKIVEKMKENSKALISQLSNIATNSAG